jgi:hypothetical protein
MIGRPRGVEIITLALDHAMESIRRIRQALDQVRDPGLSGLSKRTIAAPC